MKTMVLFYPDCIELEVMLACEILNSKYPVEVITPDGKDHIGSNGMIFQATKSLSEVNPLDYKIALFPGADLSVLVRNSLLIDIVQKLNSNKAILEAIYAGPILLDSTICINRHNHSHWKFNN